MHQIGTVQVRSGFTWSHMFPIFSPPCGLWIYGPGNGTVLLPWKMSLENVFLNLDLLAQYHLPGIPFQFGPHCGVPERRAGDVGFLFAGSSCEAHDDPGS